MGKETEELIRNLMIEMFHIQSKSNSFIQMLTKDENLSENLVLLLLRLKLNKHMKITDISDAFALTPGAATNMCDKLEELEYVERIRIKDDRRVVHVSLTNKGEERVNEIFSKFSKDRIEEISNTLVKVNKLFENILD